MQIEPKSFKEAALKAHQAAFFEVGWTVGWKTWIQRAMEWAKPSLPNEHFKDKDVYVRWCQIDVI